MANDFNYGLPKFLKGDKELANALDLYEGMITNFMGYNMPVSAIDRY